MEKDNEGSVVNSCKKDGTSNNTKNCIWKIYWLVRFIGKRGSGIIAD